MSIFNGKKISVEILGESHGEKLTMKQKMTRYISDFKNIENLIFNVIPSNTF